MLHNLSSHQYYLNHSDYIILMKKFNIFPINYIYKKKKTTRKFIV